MEVSNREWPFSDELRKLGDIFRAWSDREWTLDGASVHVSIVEFDGGHESPKVLDDSEVTDIHANLSSGVEMTAACAFPEMEHIQHEADKKGGPFDISADVAREVLGQPNTNGMSSLLVCRPWANGQDLTQRSKAKWVIDFRPGTTLGDAAGFDAAFKYITDVVAPLYASKRSTWWTTHLRLPEDAISNLVARPHRVTPMLTKHRLFVWLDHDALLPDHQLVESGSSSDDYFFGVLHSSPHELWARRMGTQLREVEQVAAKVDAADRFDNVPNPRPLIRQSAIMAAAAKDSRLKKRTLTNLYNSAHLAETRPRNARPRRAGRVRRRRSAGGWSEDWAAVWVETGAGQKAGTDSREPRTAGG